ncbi:hypothetical protein [Streptomyces peucetius]|uniref:Prephenate dehydrogenase n=1 Tax=Streptomyces peucetius TaxID=1950 RepID=A0ABY6HZU7_STRPE|nr:hypothetical protein [Streptomyces peucetius]UYQ60239.1 hypothetical protein OGH68_01265 [Streptomyces peucetius]
MTSSTNPAGSITEATALLQAELPQLEKYQQTLEQELASVTGRLESVRSALAALQALSATPIPAPREAERAGAIAADAPAVVAEEVPEAQPAKVPTAAPAPQDRPARKAKPAARTAAAGKRPARTASAGKEAEPKKETRAEKETRTKKVGKQSRSAKTVPAQDRARKTPAKSQDTAGPAVSDAAGLTDQVVAVLTRNADTPLRARDVAQALGRDGSTGSVNTVRSTLDRLVATSRAHRAGRGLYQAPRN